jgi:hypothetical protein
MKINKDNYTQYFEGRTLVLPSGTTEIAEMAVFGSDRLVTLDLSNVTSFPIVIGKRAFMRCDNLVNVKVPNGDFKIIINKRGFGLTPLKTVYNDRTTRGVMHPEMLSEISTSNGVLMLYSDPAYSNTIYGDDQVKPKGEEVRKGKASGMKTFFKKVLG